MPPMPVNTAPVTINPVLRRRFATGGGGGARGVP
jgi:hypothetical protein